jgi:hypothetical protein
VIELGSTCDGIAASDKLEDGQKTVCRRPNDSVGVFEECRFSGSAADRAVEHDIRMGHDPGCWTQIDKRTAHHLGGVSN